jgi:cysteine synthase A
MIFKNVLETLGHTPLVEMSGKINPAKARILAKVESFNVGGSIKTRIGVAMIESAEDSGEISPGATIIEPTSGNTGIGLALAAAIKGYRLILTMPENMSAERIKLAEAYGAKVVLTPAEFGMKGAIKKAEELHKEIRGSFIPMQFDNAANVDAHYRTTGPEIWGDADGKVDAFIAGVGTGGTISGVAKYLKEKNPEIKIIAVEPSDSPLLSKGTAGAHRIQGIGANFVPSILRRDLIDEVVAVSDLDAVSTARELSAKEGLLVGISSGACMWAAINIAKREEFSGKMIVALLPDTGERYLSTWMFD